MFHIERRRRGKPEIDMKYIPGVMAYFLNIP